MSPRTSLRARFYGQVPTHPLDGICHLGLVLLAAWTWLSLLPLVQAGTGLPYWRVALATMWLVIAAPILLAFLEQAAQRRQLFFWTALVRVLLALPGLALLFWELPPDAGAFSFTVLVVAYVHGSFLPLARSSGKAFLATFLPVLLATWSLTAPTALWWSHLLALPILPAALAIALLLQARSQDRRLRHLPLVLPDAPLDGRDLRGRALLGILCGSALLLLLLVQPARILSSFRSTASETKQLVEADPVAGQVQSLPPLDDPTAPTVPAPPARPVMPDTVPWQGHLVQESSRPWRTLFQVRSSLDHRGPFFGEDRPLYLRARSYDLILPQGLQASPEAIDVLYGTPSGAGEWSWLELQPQVALDRGVTFEWHGFPLRLPPEKARLDLAVLLHREPMLAVQVPELHWSPLGPPMTSTAEAKPFVYRWINSEEVATAGTLDQKLQAQDLPLLHDHVGLPASYVQLPADLALQPWLEAAHQELSSLPSAAAKVAAVMAHYRDYRYSRRVSEVAGLPSLLAFREAKRGYCTYFATAMALELRAAGVPCRLVAGFRLTRWSSQVQAYLGSEQEAHLWLEVPAADGRWIALETTPPGDLEQLLAQDLAAAVAARDEAKKLAEDAAAAEPTELAATADGLATTDTASGESPLPPPRGLRLHWVATLGTLLLALLIAWRLQLFLHQRMHRPEEGDASGTLLPPPMPDSWKQLLQYLRQEGLERERAETMTEFAYAVVVEGLSEARWLVPVVQRQQRFRFGDHRWTEQDEAETLALLAHLRQQEESD